MIGWVSGLCLFHVSHATVDGYWLILLLWLILCKAIKNILEPGAWWKYVLMILDLSFSSPSGIFYSF